MTMVYLRCVCERMWDECIFMCDNCTLEPPAEDPYFMMMRDKAIVASQLQRGTVMSKNPIIDVCIMLTC